MSAGQAVFYTMADGTVVDATVIVMHSDSDYTIKLTNGTVRDTIASRIALKPPASLLRHLVECARKKGFDAAALKTFDQAWGKYTFVGFSMDLERARYKCKKWGCEKCISGGVSIPTYVEADMLRARVRTNHGQGIDKNASVSSFMTYGQVMRCLDLE